ncbi:hypothetical protein H4R33_005183 [Dimargaris cristalligena]|uniref:Uncharacterized protein n=1 Tax=Dimargaris cristalligena TaxID=215637 RepID=A0A4P9ZQ88_9FUNG|nr:hypothetical protein H4R33_005183 [Dimargaris cristalligena]RKP35435.1 hypothetical protein BJ085DRAFT_29180 [Dimargaris cristalligena]|eukprot:RKP35435.1 hypothetical protein BJ085DRAFT_29180 [Dimargaris cristalligena]
MRGPSFLNLLWSFCLGAVLAAAPPPRLESLSTEINQLIFDRLAWKDKFNLGLISRPLAIQSVYSGMYEVERAWGIIDAYSSVWMKPINGADELAGQLFEQLMPLFGPLIEPVFLTKLTTVDMWRAGLNPTGTHLDRSSRLGFPSWSFQNWMENSGINFQIPSHYTLSYTPDDSEVNDPGHETLALRSSQLAPLQPLLQAAHKARPFQDELKMIQAQAREVTVAHLETAGTLSVFLPIVSEIRLGRLDRSMALTRYLRSPLFAKGAGKHWYQFVPIPYWQFAVKFFLPITGDDGYGQFWIAHSTELKFMRDIFPEVFADTVIRMVVLTLVYYKDTVGLETYLESLGSTLYRQLHLEGLALAASAQWNSVDILNVMLPRVSSTEQALIRHCANLYGWDQVDVNLPRDGAKGNTDFFGSSESNWSQGAQCPITVPDYMPVHLDAQGRFSLRLYPNLNTAKRSEPLRPKSKAETQEFLNQLDRLLRGQPLDTDE